MSVFDVEQKIWFFNCLDSSNSYLKRLAFVKNNTVVMVNYQTGGYGQFGRQWKAVPKSSILCSVAWNLNENFGLWKGLTLVVMFGIVRAMRQCCGVQVQVSWPNDIMASGFKLAGILCELSGNDRVVCGFGLNVSSSMDCMKKGGRFASISAETLAGRPVSRMALARLVLEGVQQAYLAWVRRNFKFVNELNMILQERGNIIATPMFGLGHVLGMLETGELLVHCFCSNPRQCIDLFQLEKNVGINQNFCVSGKLVKIVSKTMSGEFVYDFNP